MTLDNRDLWENKTAQTLSFHWDTSALDGSYDRMTNSTPQLNVDIRLCAYFETLLPDGALVRSRNLFRINCQSASQSVRQSVCVSVWLAGWPASLLGDLYHQAQLFHLISPKIDKT